MVSLLVVVDRVATTVGKTLLEFLWELSVVVVVVDRVVATFGRDSTVDASLVTFVVWFGGVLVVDFFSSGSDC